MSASYTVLLSWLLSLVPHDFTFLQQKEGSDDRAPPFYVLGLQQECMDEQLCLQVAVVAPRDYDKQVPVKGKKAQVCFSRLLNKFL